LPTSFFNYLNWLTSNLAPGLLGVLRLSRGVADIALAFKLYTKVDEEAIDGNYYITL
jgi:hypothetical protein